MAICNSENILMDISRMKKIYGVVILYNPENSVIDNILSYNKELNTLFIIDNSDVKNNKIIEKINKFENCVYIDNNGNHGIAHALNVGAKLAIKNGARWLLTMDQDSKFENDNFLKLVNYVKNMDDKKFGLFSPLHRTTIMKEPNVDIEEVMTVMTSGNIISLYAYDYVNGFNEKYFIDAVDWEYCLRLNLNSFKVIRLNNIYLKHELGNATIHKDFFNSSIVVLNHNKIRKYYMVRNKLLISKQYFRYFPKICLRYLKSILVEYKNVILYEKDKIEKLQFMTKGILDFILNKFGKKE